MWCCCSVPSLTSQICIMTGRPKGSFTIYYRPYGIWPVAKSRNCIYLDKYMLTLLDINTPDRYWHWADKRRHEGLWYLGLDPLEQCWQLFISIDTFVRQLDICMQHSWDHFVYGLNHYIVTSALICWTHTQFPLSHYWIPPVESVVLGHGWQRCDKLKSY